MEHRNEEEHALIFTPKQIMAAFAECRTDSDHFDACLEYFMYDMLNTMRLVVEQCELIPKAHRTFIIREIALASEQYFMNTYL